MTSREQFVKAYREAEGMVNLLYGNVPLPRIDKLRAAHRAMAVAFIKAWCVVNHGYEPCAHEHEAEFLRDCGLEKETP